MTVSFDAATSSTSTSFSHSCSGSDRHMLLFVKTQDESGGASATYNGVSFSAAGLTSQVEGSDLSLYRIRLLSLVAPATGSNTVAVSGSGIQSVIAASFTGVRAATPLGTVASTLIESVNPVGFSTGDMVVGASIDTTIATLSSSNTAVGTSTNGMLGGRRSDSGGLAWTGHADEKASIGVVLKQVESARLSLPLLGVGLLPILRSFSFPLSLRRPLDFNLARKYLRSPSGLYLPQSLGVG